MKAKVIKALGKVRRWALFALKWFLILSIGSVILFRWVPIPLTPLMLIRSGEQLFSGKEVRMKKDWVSLEKISTHLQLAAVCAEDQNFMNHFGFDFGAIEKAMEHNEKSKRKRGASTITQQTAKNVFLWPGRSWIRKGFEVYFTFLIEVFWSKERIMEVYLNVAEFGDGYYGAEAASQWAFKKPAQKISKPEAALLISVLPSPRKYSAKNPGPYLQGRKQWVMHQMDLWGNTLTYE